MIASLVMHLKKSVQMWNLCSLVLLAASISGTIGTSREGSVYFDKTSGQYSFEDGVDRNAAAYATFVDDISSAGFVYM